ncbi:MAG: TonB family protein [Deltaproteobacteria bacterium]|nr:TonB family protein [Deltaproteobacteria bacterium]
MTDADSRPNWLFLGLIVFSLLVHVVVFMRIADMYRPRTLSYIELTMRSTVKPVAREIPEPHTSEEGMPGLDDIRTQHIMPQGPPRLQPLPDVPSVADYPDAAPGAAETPPAPSISDVKVTEWQPSGGAAEAPAPQVPQASRQPVITKDQYQSVIRKRIVDHIGDSYRSSRAKRKNQQGRVDISIEIDAQGRIVDLKIVQSSGHRTLDRFVIREVRAVAPFAKPPDGPITVYVPFLFQLK